MHLYVKLKQKRERVCKRFSNNIEHPTRRSRHPHSSWRSYLRKNHATSWGSHPRQGNRNSTSLRKIIDFLFFIRFLIHLTLLCPARVNVPRYMLKEVPTFLAMWKCVFYFRIYPPFAFGIREPWRANCERF